MSTDKQSILKKLKKMESPIIADGPKSVNPPLLHLPEPQEPLKPAKTVRFTTSVLERERKKEAESRTAILDVTKEKVQCNEKTDSQRDLEADKEQKGIIIERAQLLYTLIRNDPDFIFYKKIDAQLSALSNPATQSVLSCNTAEKIKNLKNERLQIKSVILNICIEIVVHGKYKAHHETYLDVEKITLGIIGSLNLSEDFWDLNKELRNGEMIIKHKKHDDSHSKRSIRKRKS